MHIQGLAVVPPVVVTVVLHLPLSTAAPTVVVFPVAKKQVGVVKRSFGTMTGLDHPFSVPWIVVRQLALPTQ